MHSEARNAKTAPENAICGVLPNRPTPTGSVLWLAPISNPGSTPRRARRTNLWAMIASPRSSAASAKTTTRLIGLASARVLLTPGQSGTRPRHAQSWPCALPAPRHARLATARRPVCTLARPIAVPSSGAAHEYSSSQSRRPESCRKTNAATAAVQASHYPKQGSH